jgi:DNA-binding transcriptional ArsR family regulator
MTEPTERPDPEVRVVDDLAALAVLAHPRRRRVLEHLREHGPATSAILARALGLNTGATSYHLRELAAHGFVARAPGRGHPRQRWWRAVPADLRFPPRGGQDEATRAVLDEMNRLAFAADVAAFGRAQRETRGEWADGLPYSRGSIQVTLPELREFFEEFIALLNRYKRDPADLPEGARTVLTRLWAFPAPGPEPGPADGSASTDTGTTTDTTSTTDTTNGERT